MQAYLAKYNEISVQDNLIPDAAQQMSVSEPKSSAHGHTPADRSSSRD